MLGAGKQMEVFRWTVDDTASIVRHAGLRTYVKKEKHHITMHQESRSEVRTEDGIVHDESFRVVAPWTSAFTLGDRIGDGTSAKFEVVDVRTFPTNQQMTVIPCI